MFLNIMIPTIFVLCDIFVWNKRISVFRCEKPETCIDSCSSFVLLIYYLFPAMPKIKILVKYWSCRWSIHGWLDCKVCCNTVKFIFWNPFQLSSNILACTMMNRADRRVLAWLECGYSLKYSFKITVSGAAICRQPCELFIKSKL